MSENNRPKMMSGTGALTTGAASNQNRSYLDIIFPGDSEMARRMRGLDWSTTPLGPVEAWPNSLKTAVSICLNSRFPMMIWWGRDLVLLYNDGWRPILGENKDRHALGSRGEEVWSEIWDVLHPMFLQVLDEGKATWSDDGLLLVNRYGWTEEATFASFRLTLFFPTRKLETFQLRSQRTVFSTRLLHCSRESG